MNARQRERVERPLAAILAADVAGYSLPMGLDEDGALAALKTIPHELVDPKSTSTAVASRGFDPGTKTTGDGLLVEFVSVVDAVRCAIEVECEMALRDDGVPNERRIEFRIGINLDEITIYKHDIYGDGIKRRDE